MTVAALSRTVRRMADRVGRHCPDCADWPDEIAQRIVEEVIEAGEPLPPPDPPQRHPAEYGPCVGCGRMHRARVVAVEED
jgi:hypothetical protein